MTFLAFLYLAVRVACGVWLAAWCSAIAQEFGYTERARRLVTKFTRGRLDKLG